MEGEPTGLNPVNWAVIVLYLIGMLALGVYMSRRVKDSRGFFIAGGRLGSLLVGLSLLGTYLSALTMMGLPGKSFGPEDWLWAIQVPFLIITGFVITRFVLPWYRAAGVISVYEFLEQRIHVSARLVASVSFLFLSIGRMGLVLYLPALAFAMVTGLRGNEITIPGIGISLTGIELVVLAMGAIVTAYTVLGGIEAVIWTDAVQVIILAAGALLSVFFILYDMHLSEHGFMEIAREHHKFRMLGWFDAHTGTSEAGLSTDIAKLTSLWLVLETVFQTIRIFGTQQDMTQRYMAARSTREANKSVWVSILGYIPLAFLFYFIGSALFVYYTAHSDSVVLAELARQKPKYDAIYPHFVVTRLPLGVGGLVLAAIFAAAMSSIDSSMNSSSTVCVEDFYVRFRREPPPDDRRLRIARVLTLGWGILAVAMALIFQHVQYAQDTWSKVMSFSTTGVLALMALAFLPVRIRPTAAIAGWATAALSVVAMSFGGKIAGALPAGPLADTFRFWGTIHFLLYPVIGNIVGFAVALCINTAGALLAGRGPLHPDERLPLGVLPDLDADAAVAPPPPSADR